MQVFVSVNELGDTCGSNWIIKEMEFIDKTTNNL